MTPDPKMINIDDLMRRYQPVDFLRTWTWGEMIDDLSVESNMDFLCTDIQYRGILRPVVVGTDGKVRDGHHRIVAAHILGITEVPYVIEQAEEYYGET